jgi:hypothetical protein
MEHLHERLRVVPGACCDIVIEPATSRHRQSGLCFDRRCKVTGGKLLISERWLY